MSICFLALLVHSISAGVYDLPKSTSPTSNLSAYELPPVLVTATKYPLSSDKTGKQVRIITERELDIFPAPKFTDVVALDPSIESNGSGTQTIFLRGLGSNQTKVLYNGIDLKDPITPQGTPYFESLNLIDARQIEIVKGSEGTLYSSQAIGGVINIIPKQEGTSVDLWGGENKYQLAGMYHITLADTLLGLSGSVFRDASLSSFTGGSEKDAIEKKNYNFQLDKSFGNLTTMFMYRKNESRLDLDYLDFSKNVLDDPNYFSTVHQDLFGFKATLQETPENQSTFTFGSNSIARTTYNPTDNINTNTENTLYKGRILNFDLRHQFTLLSNLKMTVGTDFKSEMGSGLTSYSGYPSTFNETTQTTYGIYTHSEYDNTILPFQYGLRYENAYGTTAYTYSLGIYKYIEGPNFTIKANFGTGFQQPTIYEKYSDYTGNSTLKNETSMSKDLSLEKSFGAGSLSLTWFETQVDNKLDFDYSNFVYINAPSLTVTNGLETAFTLKKWGYVDFIKAGFTLNATHPSYIPNKKIAIASALSQGPITLDGSLQYVGSRTIKTLLNAYWLANAKVSYQLNEQSNLFVACENLLNAVYEEYPGYSTQERNLSLGYHYQFE